MNTGQPSISLSLDRAAQIISERGFSDIGIRELSSYIGVNVNKLYYHFPNKRQILIEIIEDHYSLLLSPDILNRQSISSYLEAVVAAYYNKPYGFLVCSRERKYLNASEASEINLSRGKIAMNILFLFRKEFVCPSASIEVGFALLEVLENALCWEFPSNLCTDKKKSLIARIMKTVALDA